jgi:hypothetical protein
MPTPRTKATARDAWIDMMHVSIMGASIARQSHDHMRDGRGAPEADDMRRFTDEAEALADLWMETFDS